MKALAKRPEDRYGSVEAFAQDLEREGLPVLARRERGLPPRSSSAATGSQWPRRARSRSRWWRSVAALWRADLAAERARGEAEARKAKAVQASSWTFSPAAARAG
jgi:hypothetical protein